VASDIQSLSLSDGVKLGSLVPAYHLLPTVSKNFHDISFPGLKLLLQKNGKIYFTNKTDALGILAVGSRQTCCRCQPPYLGFNEIPYWKKGFGKLALIELAQKIGLVFIGSAPARSLKRPPGQSPDGNNGPYHFFCPSSRAALRKASNLISRLHNTSDWVSGLFRIR
jgi:hypothetical protein